MIELNWEETKIDCESEIYSEFSTSRGGKNQMTTGGKLQADDSTQSRSLSLELFQKNPEAIPIIFSLILHFTNDVVLLYASLSSLLNLFSISCFSIRSIWLKCDLIFHRNERETFINIRKREEISIFEGSKAGRLAIEIVCPFKHGNGLLCVCLVIKSSMLQKTEFHYAQGDLNKYILSFLLGRQTFLLLFCHWHFSRKGERERRSQNQLFLSHCRLNNRDEKTH